MNVSLDKAILFFICVPSGVIVKPKYLKMSTCFYSFPFAENITSMMNSCL